MRSLTVLRQKSPRSKSTFPTALRRLGAALVGVALGFGLVGCGVGATVLPGNLPPVGGGAGIAIVTFDTVDGVLGRVYEKHIETSGTTPPIIACTILTGALPPGLTVVTGEDFTPADVTDDDECIITGTPTTLGTFGFVLEGRDSALISSTDEEDFTITIRQEFQITSFDVVDAVAGRDYFKAFKVFTNLSNNPTPTEIASTERGNGPIVACNILGLPANMSFTCVPDGTGLAVDVTLFNSGVLAASGPLALTIEITDSDIVQTARVVVVGRPLSNATTSPSFAVGFTIRAEFTITSAVPLLPEGTQTGPYNQVVSVTTNLTDNANDVGQAGESGNGPVTDCVINGLPTNLSSSFVLTGGGTGCDITIDGGTITDLIGLYTLSLVVSDSDILQAAAIVVNLSSQVQNPTLNVNGPLAFTLSTVDAGTTNACTGGTFADASNVAPDAVLGRTYGGPARCDLLFTATGGSGPMVWTQNSVGFLVCTIESINPSDNRLLRCNSAGAGASGATFALDVEVTDNNSTNVTQDVNTHTSHTLNVRAALTLTPATATANAPPPGVQSRTYGDTGAGFTALVYNAANGLAPFVFTLPASVGAPAVNGVPANVACVSAATSATCSSGVNPVTAAVGNYPFTVTVNDTQNDTTPSGNAPVARSIDIFAALALAADNAISTAPPNGVRLRGYGSGATCDADGAFPHADVACTPLSYTASAGLPPYVFTLPAPEASPSGNGVPTAVACGAVGATATCTTGGSTITANADIYPFDIVVDDTANATTPGSAAVGDTVTFSASITVNPPLEFRLATTPDGTPGSFTDVTSFPPGVRLREYSVFPGIEVITFLPTAGSGLGAYSWEGVSSSANVQVFIFPGGAPGDLECFTFFNGVDPLSVACIASFFTPPVDVQPTAGTFPFVVNLGDPGNPSTPAGLQQIDVNGNGPGDPEHDVVINSELALAVSVGGVPVPGDLPEAVDGRDYGDSTVATCGAAGNVACAPVVYTASGGVGDPTLNGSYAFSSTTGLLVPGAGFPDQIGCNTGTNPNADLNSCAAGPGQIVDVTTTGAYTPQMQVDDLGNVLTPSSTATGTPGLLTRTLPVKPELTFSLNLDPPPLGVEGRTYADTGGGFSALIFTPDATTGLTGAYTWAQGGAALPGDLACTQVGDDLECASSSSTPQPAVASSIFTVTVDDTPSATTPGGSTSTDNAAHTDHTVNISAALDLNVNVGTQTGTAPAKFATLPDGVIGRVYADGFVAISLCGGAPCSFVTYTASAGLGVYDFSASSVFLTAPGEIPCFPAFPGPSDYTCSSIFGGPLFLGTPGLFTSLASVSDFANATTPAGTVTISNELTVQILLAITSLNPLNSAIDAVPYANTLTGTGGLPAKVWSTTDGNSGVPTLSVTDADCTGLDVDAAGNISGAATAGVVDNNCAFGAVLNDTTNGVTPGSLDPFFLPPPAITGFNIPIAPAGSPVIDNDVLLNGLEGLLYSHRFTASGGAGTNVWTVGAAAGAACSTGGGGTEPTGTAMASNVPAPDEGTLSGTATTASTFDFSVCVKENAGAGPGFDLKNFRVVINDASVYVSNAGSNNVSIIDSNPSSGGFNTVTATLATNGSTPRAVAVSPDGTRALVTNQNSDNVSVFDTTISSLTDIIPIGTNSLGVAITPDGLFAYATGFPTDDVKKIDLATGAVVNTIAVGSGPRGIAITPDGSKAYVANSGSNDVSVIDLTSDTVSATVAVGTAPHGVAVTPEGLFALVTNNGSNNVNVIATATDTVVDANGATLGTARAVGTGPEGITITPDGTRAYVANEGNNITIINLENNTDFNDQVPIDARFGVPATITLAGNAPQGIDATPDGLNGYVATVLNSSVTRIDIDPASGTFNATGPTITVGSGPESELGVRAVPYPVLHFTLAVDAGSGRRILAAADDDNNYSDFIRVMGGVAPYSFADTGGAGNTLADNNCSGDFVLNPATGEITATAVFNPPGAAADGKLCHFQITATDSATVPQTITGDFRIVVSED